MQSGYCVVFFLMMVSIAAFLGDLTTISDCLGYSLNSHKVFTAMIKIAPVYRFLGCILSSTSKQNFRHITSVTHPQHI